jgi:hypothetical protein
MLGVPALQFVLVFISLAPVKYKGNVGAILPLPESRQAKYLWACYIRVLSDERICQKGRTSDYPNGYGPTRKDSGGLRAATFSTRSLGQHQQPCSSRCFLRASRAASHLIFATSALRSAASSRS